MSKETKGAAIGTRLSKEQVEYFKQYLNRLRQTMRLRDWTIRVDFTKTPPDGAYAANTQFDHSRHCELSFADSFLDLSGKEQTQTIVHELVHCYLFEVHTSSLDAMEAVVGGKALAIFDAGITAQVELATDTVADVIAPLVEQFKLPTSKGFQPSAITAAWDQTKILA